MPRRLPILASVALAGSLSCGTSASTADASAAAEVFVAFPSDLCAYPSWTSYTEPDAGGDAVLIPDASADGGVVHAGGGRVEYINHVPPHGSTEFPVGTMIVKTIPGQPQIFAMAKRGGGYNMNGPGGAAINWEWFELSPTACSEGFVWSGAFPPMNQSYGGTPDACNQCHSGFASSNDYVASPKIRLKDY
jgi:hypothetical protein